MTDDYTPSWVSPAPAGPIPEYAKYGGGVEPVPMDMIRPYGTAGLAAGSGWGDGPLRPPDTGSRPANGWRGTSPGDFGAPRHPSIIVAGEPLESWGIHRCTGGSGVRYVVRGKVDTLPSRLVAADRAGKPVSISLFGPWERDTESDRLADVASIDHADGGARVVVEPRHTAEIPTLYRLSAVGCPVCSGGSDL